MKVKAIIYEAEEGGYWAEIPGIPGCSTQGEDFEELLQNIHEAVEGCLSVDIESPCENVGKVMDCNLKVLSGKEFIKVLERQGWELARIHGSHHIYIKQGFNVRLSVPVHGNQPLKKGLQRHLMKLAEIGEKDLI